MDTLSWISLIAGITSIVLAVVSICLSITFFRWTDKSNKEMTKTSNIIAEKSEYLGKLFDKMIETTFSLVREDSEAMRLHIFSQNDVGKTKTTGEEKDKVDTSENSNLDTSII